MAVIRPKKFDWIKDTLKDPEAFIKLHTTTPFGDGTATTSSTSITSPSPRLRANKLHYKNSISDFSSAKADEKQLMEAHKRTATEHLVRMMNPECLKCEAAKINFEVQPDYANFNKDFIAVASCKRGTSGVVCPDESRRMRDPDFNPFEPDYFGTTTRPFLHTQTKPMPEAKPKPEPEYENDDFATW